MRGIGDLFIAFKAHEGKKALGQVLSTSVLNQMVSSGANFGLGVYLVRTLSPMEFGLYGIGFAVSLFYAGFGNALFLTQMVVHTPEKIPEDRLPYAGRIFLLIVLFCSSTVLLFFFGICAGSAVWDVFINYAEYVAALTAASVAYLLKEFFIRHAYNVRREIWALAINASTAFTIIALVCIQYYLLKSFSVEMALWIYAVAQTGGALLGCLLARLPINAHQLKLLPRDLKEAWRGGKWASVTNVVYFARAHAHTIVVASLLGPAGVAKLNAARLLVTPAVFLIPALGQVAMPRLAAVRSDGMHKLMKWGFVVTFVLLLMSVFYCFALLVGYDFVVEKVLGDGYQDLFVITALWCLYTVLLSLRSGAEMISTVLKKFRSLTTVNTVSAIVSLLSTFWLAVSYGLPGALIGVAVGEIILLAMLYYLLYSIMTCGQNTS